MSSIKQYYGVAHGRVPGIYTNFSLVNEQMDGFHDSSHSEFDNLQDCIKYMLDSSNQTLDSIVVFGERGGQYNLKSWCRKFGYEDLFESHNKSIDRDTVEFSNDAIGIPERDPTLLRVCLPKKTINNAILAYITYSLQRGTVDKIKRAVMSHFSSSDILGAKESLWQNCDNNIIGHMKSRRDGQTKSEIQSNIDDILKALQKLDATNNTPVIVLSASDIGRIPRSCPEELNSISVIDRLNCLEDKVDSLCNVIDHTVACNIGGYQ